MKPFPVDPEVMARIRPMRGRDVPAVARLHHAAMGRSLWARLGLPFLEALYRALAQSPLLLAFVYEEDGHVRGFIAGSPDSSRLFRETLRAQGWTLVLPAILGILRDPSLLISIVTTPMYFTRSRVHDGVSAESMFCSFEPDLRGRRVSGHINKVLFDELLHQGHRYVKVTTDADNEAAIRQLRSWGFEDAGTFRFYGKVMCAWVLDLEESDRVEPVSRHTEDPGPR